MYCIGGVREALVEGSSAYTSVVQIPCKYIKTRVPVYTGIIGSPYIKTNYANFALPHHYNAVHRYWSIQHSMRAGASLSLSLVFYSNSTSLRVEENRARGTLRFEVYKSQGRYKNPHKARPWHTLLPMVYPELLRPAK